MHNTFMVDFFQSQNGQMILQLLLAAFLGGLLGLEREFRKKAAGLRTYLLVCLGCTVFTIVSYESLKVVISGAAVDPTRIAAQILTGIGFIGAGVIMKKEDKIEGVTTAAGLWITAAIGIAVGFKLYLLSLSAAVLTLLVLVILRIAEDYFEKKSPGNKNE
jgi:putative Mg2+ transporter-C (MgtC) family protein